MAAVDCLIFSKDRAAQLDLLLRSINAYAADVYERLVVLWTASEQRYVDGYGRVMVEHRAPYWRHQHTPALSFENEVRGWLAERASPVSFLVDDCVFYRSAPRPERLPFSYRGGDYDYPFSLDGNVYERVHVLHLLRGLMFRDPTELEAAGHGYRHRLPFAEVHRCEPPCLVGVPLNRVSISSGMPHMGRDLEELNARYLAGERLALPSVDGDLPAHAELELEFA